MGSRKRIFLLFLFATIALLLMSCGAPKQFETVTDVVNIPGDPQDLVMDSQGKFAYLSNGSGLLVLDLATRELTANYPVPLRNARLNDIDDSDSLVVFHGMTTITRATDVITFDVKNGTEQTLLKGNALYGVAFANNFVYAADFNDRGLHIASIDGSNQALIKPYSESSSTVATPISITSSPDGTRVVFGDEFNQALHVVNTDENVVTATIAAGIAPRNILFLDNDTVQWSTLER